MQLLSKEVGKKIILLGNEAIVRGALESGVGFASTYPGTPASEIGDTFSAVAKAAGIYFEYSTNEKVALEAAAAAAICGVRSLVSFKHFGLNVATDSLFPLAYIGVNAGMVVVVADDPSGWSSAQSEQDSRLYARIAHLPMLEPSEPAECKEFVKLAFDLSERFKIPVLIRETTRVSHVRGLVKLGRLVKGKTAGKFVKDAKRYTNMPPYILEVKERLLEKIEKIRAIGERSKINFIVNGKGKLGVITSGVSFNYVLDAMDMLKKQLPVLKIGMSYPLPENKIKKFISKLDSVLIVEELDPVLEHEVVALAKEANPKLKIFGKKLLPKVGEYKFEHVLAAISKLTGKKYAFNFKRHMRSCSKTRMPKRQPTFCPGCPHRAIFYAAKVAAGPKAVFGGDIGCYILGVFPPIEAQDFIFSMGASQGLSHGIKKVSKQKVIAFIGDSTFFHAGIPGLINMVYNKSNPLVIALDNRITAMTGHQPHPGAGFTGMGERAEEIKIEKIAEACGVKHVKVINPYNVRKAIATIKEFLEKDELALIVSKAECRLLTLRKARRAGIELQKFELDSDKLTKEQKLRLLELGCPAIVEVGGRMLIEKNLCTGCGVCAQLAPGAIKPMTKKQK